MILASALCGLISTIAPVTTAAGQLAASPAPPRAAVTVSALVCGADGPADGALVAETIRALSGTSALRADGVDLVPFSAEDRCRPSPTRPTGPEPVPDLVLVASVAGGQAVERARMRVGFRFEGHDVILKLFGRQLSGTLTASTLVIPTAPAANAVEPRVAGTADTQAAAGAAAIMTPWLQVTTGLVEALAYRKLAALPDQTDEVQRLGEANRRAAVAALALADSDWLATEAPLTAAVIKQVRATLLFDETCPSESPRDLFYAASRLAPYSADARVLIALARLKEAYYPPFCAVAVEQELFRSLDLNPWNNEAVDDLGILYELALNAQPESRAPGQVSADDAAQRLDRVWQKEVPASPLALELGVAASLSSTADQSNRELGPGLRLDFSYGRDGTGLGVRLGIELPWARQSLFPTPNGGPSPWVSWTRPTLDIGPRYRLRVGASYGEVEPALLIAAVVAVGHGFDTNYTATGINVGSGGTLRLGRRLGRFSLWIGSSIAYFFGTTSLQLSAIGGSGTGQLPKLDISLLAGASALVWR